MAQRIADIFLEREEQTLSPYAFLTKNTRGRDHPYVPCENRTEFQRDRDRILHSKSFRRLMHKTQVFLFPADEHYRTRIRIPDMIHFTHKHGKRSCIHAKTSI